MMRSNSPTARSCPSHVSCKVSGRRYCSCRSCLSTCRNVRHRSLQLALGPSRHNCLMLYGRPRATIVERTAERDKIAADLAELAETDNIVALQRYKADVDRLAAVVTDGPD